MKSKKPRILKKHVGRPMDFYGWNRHANIVCHGRIESVKNGMAKLVDVIFPGDGSNFTMHMPVRCDHIIEIY